MKKLIFLIINILVSGSLYINAQNDSLRIVGKEIFKADKMQEKFSSKAFSPLGQANLTNFFSNVSLTSAYKEGENGKIEFRYTKEWRTYGLSVNQSISKSNKEAIPIDMDGLNPGTSIELNFQRMFWNPVVTKEVFDEFQLAKDRYAKDNKIDKRLIMLSDILSDPVEKEKLDIKLKQPWFFNISFSVNKTEFNYVTDSVRLAEINKAYISPKLRFSIGLPIYKEGEIKSFIAMSYIFSITHSAADDLTLLTPFGTTGNFVSKSVSFGNPEKATDNRFNFEWRTTFNIGDNINIGISPTATYGVSSGKFAVSFPVYFIHASADDGKLLGLQGGIRFSYLTETKNGKISNISDGLGAQIIITAPFDMSGSFKK